MNSHNNSTISAVGSPSSSDTQKRAKKLVIVGVAVLGVVLIGFLIYHSVLKKGLSGMTKPSSADQPNIILILTDDLDYDSIKYMPKLKKYLTDEGTSFSRFFLNYPLCCPSRATILRGQNANNTHIKGNNPPNGGFKTFREREEEKETLGVWFQRADYQTAFIGKYLNGYGKDAKSADSKGRDTYVPPGWNLWKALYTQEVFDYQLNENGKIVEYGSKESDFKTDVLSRHTIDFLDTWERENGPFYIHLTPTAPHSPATPASRHRDLFSTLTAPRTPSFNETDTSDKPVHIQSLPLLTSAEIADLDEKYRNRIGSLQAVDDMIEALIKKLEEKGELDNTYIFFSSDNGYHLGQHRLDPGKGTIYEEDIRVPLIVRGPGIAKGGTIDKIVGNVDFAPTFAEIAGLEIPIEVDGRSFAGLLSQSFTQPPTWRNGYLIGFEADVLGINDKKKETKTKEGGKKEKKAKSNEIDEEDDSKRSSRKVYAGVRTNNYMYAQFQDGQEELYDLRKDPYELISIHKSASPALIKSLQDMLTKLRTCAGDSCRLAEEMLIQE